MRGIKLTDLSYYSSTFGCEPFFHQQRSSHGSTEFRLPIRAPSASVIHMSSELVHQADGLAPTTAALYRFLISLHADKAG
jgi:hypothetical protein